MTVIEKAVKIVSDLYEFYRKIPKFPSRRSVRDDEPNQALRRTARERELQPSEDLSARRR